MEQQAETVEIRNSEDTDQLFGAMVTAQAMIQKAKADSYNQYHRSYYADMASAVEATRPALAEAGLAVMQFPGTRTSTIERSFKDDDGKPQFFEDGQPIIETVPVIYVLIRTRLIHASGQWIESDLEIPVSMGNRPAQAVGSTITYGRRYAWMAILGVAADEDDDDGNVASGIDGPTTSREFTPRTQPQSPPARDTRPQPRRQGPARPQGTAGRVQFHCDRLREAENLVTLRAFYEAAVRELEEKATAEQAAELKKVKDEMKQRFEAVQEAPPVEEESQDEMIEPEQRGVKTGVKSGTKAAIHF